MDLTNIIATMEIEDYSTLSPSVPGTGPVVALEPVLLMQAVLFASVPSTWSRNN